MAGLLALLFAFLPLMAAPAEANSTAQAVYLSPTGVELIDESNGSADWATAQSNTGSNSVLLDAGTVGGTNAGRIQILLDDPIPIADFTGATYSVWEPAGTEHGGVYPHGGPELYPFGDPYINILLDTEGDGLWSGEKLEGLASIAVGSATSSPHSGPPAETWTEMEEGYGFHDSDDSLPGSSPATGPGNSGTVVTLAAWQTWFQTNATSTQVVGVQITFGFWGLTGDVLPDVYVDDVTINGVTYDLERYGTTGAPVQTTSLDAGWVYDLHLSSTSTSGIVTLSDMGTDLLPPVGSSTAAILTLSNGVGTFYSVEPLYASAGGAYIKLDGGNFSDFRIPVLASAYEGVSVATTATSFEKDVAKTFTVTVTQNDVALGSALVQVWLDDDMDGEVTGDTLITSGPTTTAGTRTFTVTPVEAGQIILRVTKDIGGTLGTPANADGVNDIDNQTSKTTISPIVLTITSSPVTLRRGWTEQPTYTVTEPDGDKFTLGATIISLKGTPLNVSETSTYATAWSASAYVKYVKDNESVKDTNATAGEMKSDKAFTPNAIGTISVKASYDTADGGVDGVPEYLGTLAQTVQVGEALNVDVSPATWVAGSSPDLVVTILDSEQAGPDGASTGSNLSWVKTVVSMPSGQSFTTGNWDGENDTALLGNAVWVDGDNIKFVARVPNDASSDITVTVTGELDNGNAVGPVTKTIVVTGYVVTNLVPSADLALEASSAISMTVSTKTGGFVNNAEITITAALAAGFEKDIDDDGVLESFQAIVIDGALGTITYDTVEPEAFLVDGGNYAVTGIQFVKIGDVAIVIKEATGGDMKASFPTPFEVLGLGVYDLVFDPLVLTAGVDGTGLEITVTEDGVAVTDAVIKIDGDTATVSSVDNVYTVSDTIRSATTSTLVIMARKADGTKYGSDTLSVELPTLTWEITDADEVRNVMLVGEAYDYSIASTSTDAVGDPLASGKVWMGTYNALTEAFTAVGTTTPVAVNEITLETNGGGEFTIDQDGTGLLTDGTLVWKIGDSTATEAEAALVLGPAITVEDPVFSLGWTPLEPVVGVVINFTVTDNYGDVAGSVSVEIVTPGGDPIPKTTTPLGVFQYTGAAAGIYYVSVAGQAAVEVEVYMSPVITVANLVVAPTLGEVPVTIIASAAVTNSGGVAGDYTAELKIDGVVVDSDVVSVAAGATETVAFSYVLADVGTYLVTIDGLTAVTVEVEEPVSTLELYEGANPILYTGVTTSLPEALSNISDVAEIIWQRDESTGGNWQSYIVAAAFGEITELENGTVYIVVVSEDVTWELPQ